MSELQAALLAIGSGVVVAVYVYGWWQQRKYRRKFGAAFKSSHEDALYREEPVRPLPDADEALPAAAQPVAEVEHFVSVSDEVPVAESKTPGTGEQPSTKLAEDEPRHEEQSFEKVDENAPGEETPAMAEPEPVAVMDESCALLDLRSDFIVELQLSEPSPASALSGLWQRKFDFGKPVQVCGLTLAGPSSGPRWERAVAEGPTLYSRFRVALQLVDRSGAVSAAKLADFRDLVLGIAGRIKSEAAVPDVQQAHQAALELDTFCAEVDQMVGVNLVVPGERLLSGTRIAEAAALQGMTLEADGAFHLLGAHGHSLFGLINQDSMPFQHHTLATHTTRGLTLLLDVPRIDSPAVQFDRMLAVAHGLARELQLNLVDDHRVVLTEIGLARIREQIVAVEDSMRDHGIAPGSALARRLFA